MKSAQLARLRTNLFRQKFVLSNRTFPVGSLAYSQQVANDLKFDRPSTLPAYYSFKQRSKPSSGNRNPILTFCTAATLAGSIYTFRSPTKCEEAPKTWVELGARGDFKDGEMYEIKVQEGLMSVLLSKIEGNFYCCGAKCSHYAAPLCRGTISEKHVTCPLHGAEFDIKTGKVTNGPALDSIPVYEVMEKDGILYGLFPSQMMDFLTPTTVKRDPSDMRVFAIVGSGAAALAAAETLRQEGYTGRILMLTNESILPYDRPVLSKNLAFDLDKITLRKESYLVEELDVEFRSSCPVTTVDAKKNSIVLANGETIKYDKALISTGGEPRHLEIPGNDLQNILYLRRPEDTKKISEFAKQNLRVAVIGSSFIGMEIASAICKSGAKVTVIGKESVPLQRVLGEKVGKAILKLSKEKGIDFIPNAAAKCFKGKNGAVNAVVLENGDVIQADAVVIGAGVTLNTDLVEGVEKQADGSIPVDPFLKSKSAANLYAAGDVATFPYIKTGRDIRIEHWDVAMQHGRIAAKNMNGAHEPYTAIPFFWSAMFGKSLRYAGHCTSFDDVICEGDLQKYSFVAYYIKDNKVVAVATMGKDPFAVAACEALRLNLMPSPAELAFGFANSTSIMEKLKERNKRVVVVGKSTKQDEK